MILCSSVKKDVARVSLAFLTIFRRLPKILQNLFEGHANVAKNVSKFSEDCRTLSNSSKTQRCLHYTPTNLSTI